MNPDDERVRLLLVDDEVEFLNSTAKALRRRGFEVTTVQNPAVGLKLLEHEAFDVVVLDVKMPGMDGLEVLRRIKAAYPLCAVLLLTGLPTVSTVIEGLKEGAFDYLVKPQDVELLVRKIHEAFQHSRSQAEEAREKPVEKILNHSND